MIIFYKNHKFHNSCPTLGAKMFMQTSLSADFLIIFQIKTRSVWGSCERHDDSIVEICNTLSFKTLCNINNLFYQTTDFVVSQLL